MGATLLLHIAAGGVGLLSGYLALYAAKGAGVHRRAGTVFVAAMLVMCAAGVWMAASRGLAPAVNVPAGLLTAYLVVTSLSTVRPPAAARCLHLVGMLTALPVALACLAFGAEALAAGGSRQGIPAFPYLMFGVVAALAFAGDLRLLRSGPPRGPARLYRHLWRMSFALFIATLSFFLGQADVIPAPLRKPPLLALPVVAVLATMLYWMWRFRSGAGRAARHLRPLPAVPARAA